MFFYIFDYIHEIIFCQSDFKSFKQTVILHKYQANLLVILPFGRNNIFYVSLSSGYRIFPKTTLQCTYYRTALETGTEVILKKDSVNSQNALHS